MKSTVFNTGPQHPVVYVVLRLVIESRSEIISHVTCTIGLLHRGTEKLCEYMEYYKILPLFSRFWHLLGCKQLYSLTLERTLLAFVFFSGGFKDLPGGKYTPQPEDINQEEELPDLESSDSDSDTDGGSTGDSNNEPFPEQPGRGGYASLVTG